MRTQKALLLLLLISLISSCGGGSSTPDDDSGNGNNNFEEVAFSRSEDIFAAAEQTFADSLEEDDDLQKAYQAAADYLNNQPEVLSVQFPQAGVSSAGFIARLKNGLGYAIAFRQAEDTTQSSKPLSNLSTNLEKNLIKRSAVKSRASGLTTNKKVLLIDSFWNLYQDCKDKGCPVISDILETKALLEKYDYDVTLVANTSFDDYRNINNYDIVYIGAHGVYYEEDGSPHFAILTDQARSADFEESGVVSVTEMIVITGFARGFGGIIRIPTRNYAVTEGFFSNNTGAFRHDSIVYADTCFSTTRKNDLIAPPLVGVLAGFNLNTYLGWNESVNSVASVKASNYLFSHMLGDIPDSMAYLSAKTPPIRPNGLHAAMSGLEEKGWTVDTSTFGAVLEHMDLHQGTRELLFRPSIDGMFLDVDIENEEQKLTLTGEFGDLEGSVELCDATTQDADSCSELSMDNWSDDEITVDLGSDCASGCTGGIRVVVEEHKSNVHPLTEWKAQFEVNGQYSAIGPTVEMTIKANIRGEIVDERATAEGDPEDGFSQSVAMLGLDSTVDYKFSGDFEDTNYTYKYSGDGTLTPGVSGNQGFSGAITLKPADSEAAIMIPVIAEAFMERTQKQSPFTMDSMTTTIGIVIYQEGSMDKYGTINGDTINLGSLDATYQNITPSNAPDDDTPR